MSYLDKAMQSLKNIMVVCLLVGCFSVTARAEERWTTIEKNISVVKGATRVVEMDSTSVDDKMVSIKKVASIKVKDFCVKIKGLKKGKTTCTFSIPEINKKYIIHVTVLSKATVKKESTQALQQYLDKKAEGTRYIYVDLNKDGIKELVLKKKIVYYNYETHKVETVKNNYSTIYICNKNDTIYCELKKQRKTKAFVYFSEFYQPNLYKVFALDGTGTGFRKYTAKGKRMYGVTADYAYYDTTYDQDDYDYEAFSQQEMKKRIAKKMPKYKKLKWKKK